MCVGVELVCVGVWVCERERVCVCVGVCSRVCSRVFACVRVYMVCSFTCV